MAIIPAANLDIFALFSDSVLEISEGTKVSTNIILKYSQNDKSYTRKYAASIDMYDRNAITWDDDRKVAAFVTAKDPSVKMGTEVLFRQRAYY